MGFYTRPTASILSEMGRTLRNKIKTEKLVKPTKYFVVKADETEENLIKKQEKVYN